MDRHTNAAPIIIKRKKVVGHAGSHGGAWKIAFADFATAMMAFFLVMWLINATTESQRRGLADYFSPSVPVSRQSGGGDGAFGGHEIWSDDVLPRSGRGEAADSAGEQEREGDPYSGGHASRPDAGADSDDTADDTPEALARQLADILQARGGESMAMEQALRHIVTRVTDEGLIVELFDLPDQPLFEGEGDTPTLVLGLLAEVVAEVFALVDNPLSVEGHLRSLPVVWADNPVWAASTARAQRMRALLEGAGLAPERMRRVIGHADRQPVARNATAVRNNRLEVILLRDAG